MLLFKRKLVAALLTATLLVPLHAQQDDDVLARDLVVLKRPPWPWPPRQGCVESNTFFGANVVVTFEGDPTLDASIFMELEDSFAESYNTLRKSFCDDESRKVVDVEADQESVNIKGFNEFSLLFQVRVGCDRCSTSDTTLFEMEPEKRRELAVVYKRKPYNIIHGGMVAPTTKPTPEPSKSPVNTAGVRDDTDSECCPPNAPKRAPYAREFVAAYDATYKAIDIVNRRLQGNPIEQVIGAIEVSPISCEDPLEDFETSVFVEFGGDLESAVDSEIFALEESFQTSYNGFGEEVVCDPLFRVITEVKTEEVDEIDERYLTEEERKVQGTKRFNYRVKGRCRGCRSNPRLFAQGSSGRRGRRQLEMAYSRQLQFVFDEGQCFCAVGAEERGVFEDEFTVVYDENIQELRDEGIVENVDTVKFVEEEEDPPWTWSPTTSPTNFPTGPTDSPVPSPSPSRIPSASPTEG
jgi:hypothetical protein